MAQRIYIVTPKTAEAGKPIAKRLVRASNAAQVLCSKTRTASPRRETAHNHRIHQRGPVRNHRRDRMKTRQIQATIRQGDVLLTPCTTLPAGCTEVPLDKGRIVLAYGEVTGHTHAIADHGQGLGVAALQRVGALDGEEHEQAIAAEIADAVIARAKLWRAPSGERYLEVLEAVTLRHEEHTAHTILPGIYHLPQQVEYSPAALRRVED
jgi:hypothetical protein